MQKSIYALVDPRTEKVRYVGASQDVDRRINEHLNGYTGSLNQIQIWLDELHSLGLSMTWRVLEKSTKDWLYRERSWISTYKLRGEADLNELRSMSNEQKATLSSSRNTEAWRKQTSETMKKIWEYRRSTGYKKPSGSRKRGSTSANIARGDVSTRHSSSGGSEVPQQGDSSL